MSCNGGGCVVVDTAEDGTVYLSSDRRPEEPPTAIDADEWAAFLADVKAGRYDGAPFGNPDPSRRLTLDESQAVIKERYSGAIDALSQT